MKKFSLLLALIMVFATLLGAISYADDDDGGKTYEDGYDDGYGEGYQAGKNSAKTKTPIIRVKESLETPTVEAGDEFDFEVTFHNDSNHPAFSVVITPQLDDSATLVYERPLLYRYPSTFRQTEDLKVSFHLKTNPEAKTGTYPLKFKIEYQNNMGESFTREESAYYKITTSKSKPLLNIENIHFSEDVLQYGGSFNMFFDIYNMGETAAKDVEVKLSGFESNTIFPVDSNDYSYVGEIGARSQGSKSVVKQGFSFKISPEITVKETSIKATITYKNNDDKESTVEKTFYITGITPKPKESGDEEEKKEDIKYAKPKIIISSYNLSQRNITAGDDFTFSFTFKNTSKEKDIRNIKITINSFEGSLLISKGSNTFYVEHMDKNSSLSRSIDLLAKQDLKSSSYELYIEFEYEDYDGAEYTSKGTINVPVTEYSKLVINSASAGDTYVGNPTSLTFEYVNMGKSTISNLIARIKSDTVTTSQETVYIGNVQSGSSDYYDIEVTPTEVGKNVGTIILSFEDSSGKTFEVTRDFEINAMEEYIPEYDPSEMIEEGEIGEDDGEVHFEVWQIVLAGIGTFLVALLLGKIITKKILMRKFENDI